MTPQRVSRRPMDVGFALIATIVLATPAAAQYSTRVANRNLMGVTVTNYGFVGNNFVSRSPSMEYPLGTGYEHLVRGGLWIGGNSSDKFGAFTGVTTAAIDGSPGINPAGGTEYTPTDPSFRVRSSIPVDPDFDPAAVSEQDVLATFNDVPLIAGHRPLAVFVNATSYAWTVAGFEHTLFMHYVIHNGGFPLTNVHVGLYTELASGPKNDYSTWPPSAGGSVYGSWYSKKLLAWDADLRMIREHRCDGYPIPGGCHFEITPAWAGVKLLTPLADGQAVTLAAWNYSPGNPLRDEDSERYALMSAGTIQDLTTPDLQPVTGDPVELLAIGPFPSIAPGDSIVIDFALVGGADEAAIQQHAREAQALYDVRFVIGSVPALASFVEATALESEVTLTWLLASGLEAARIERRDADDAAWREIGTASADAAGLLHWRDTGVDAGRRYGYRLAVPDGAGGESFLGEAWVETPAGSAFALHGALGNPVRAGRVPVAFSLPDARPATLELADVTGRRVLAREVGGFGRGRHVLELKPTGVAPGVYFIRLVQGSRRDVAKITLIQ